MRKEFLYKEFNAVAKEYQFPYGKSVAITIFQKDGVVRNKIKFVCHPDNKEFDYYQNMDIAKLMDIAIERVTSEMYDSSFDDAREHQLEIWVPFNSPDATTETPRRPSAGT